MYKIKFQQFSVAFSICLAVVGCKAPSAVTMSENKAIPESFGISKDSANSSNLNWNNYFNDPDLVSLISVALKNNQELMITLQEVEMAKNDIRVRKGGIIAVSST